MSRYSAIIALPQAEKRDVDMLKDWISRPDLEGIGFSGDDLYQRGNSVYGDMFLDDLTILNRTRGENDPLTRFLAGPAFHAMERLWRILKVSQQTRKASGEGGQEAYEHQHPIATKTESQDVEGNLYRYSDSHIVWIIDILGTTLASMTPLVAIIILYFVTNLGARLGVLCACTFIFSIALRLVTNGRRIEIFACTAAWVLIFKHSGPVPN